MSFRDDMKGSGYSKEEEYFHRKDLELLNKLREQSEAKRKQTENDNRKKEYWMRCPKCGSGLKEESYAGLVNVDHCTNPVCGGVYLDGGELEILLKGKPSLFTKIFGR